MQRVNAAIHAIDEILTSSAIDSVAEVEPQDSNVARRIWAPTQKHTVFEALACDKELLDIVACLIGDNIIFHYSRLNMKAPRIGSPVSWHQDFAYNPHTNTDLLTCLIYLDDADKSNGCLQVMPGSHKQKLYDHYIDGYFRGKVSTENLPTDFATVHLEAPAGSVIFIHCLTLHQSLRNRSDKPRRAFLPSFRAADSFPIYIGAHTGNHEPTTKLVRGVSSKVARVESGVWQLPFAEKEFGSLYQIQEGSHLHKNREKTGYFGHLIK